jgi:type I restriction enzyme M protein
VVLDTGAVIRGSGARHEDRERNIRKWFVDRDLIDGAIPLTGLVGYDGMVALTLNAFKVPVPEDYAPTLVDCPAFRRWQSGRADRSASFSRRSPSQGLNHVCHGRLARP